MDVFSRSVPAATTASPYKDGNTTIATVPHPETQQSTVQYQSRIDISQDLKWRIITCYSPHSEKAPELEWQCLLAIARARGNGISKLDLMNATGLGKITIGRQTSLLMEKNYIEKQEILLQNRKTCIFKLKVTVGASSKPNLEVNPLSISSALRSTPTRASTRPQRLRALAPVLDPTSEFDKFQTKPNQFNDVTFMTYDECQRKEGVPGVYFDLNELNAKRIGSKGRPKKRMIALFKSERLKTIPWMHNDLDSRVTARTAAKSTDANTAILNISGSSFDPTENSSPKTLKRKCSFEGGTSTEEPPYKTILLDGDRSLGESYFSSHHSHQMPFSSAALNSVAPYSATASCIPESQSIMRNSPLHEMQHKSSYLTQLSSPSNQNYKSPYALGQSLSLEEMPKLPPQLQQISESSEVHIDSAERELENAIKAAQKSDIPNVTCRLSVSWKGKAGNLCLFSDQKVLEFRPYDQPGTNALCIQISEIYEPPQTSTKGSNPMELKISLGKEDASKTVHIFSFLLTDDEFKAANRLRAKVVTIMTVQEFRPGSSSSEADREISKPYQCVKCGKTWKNELGVFYHQTKSRTACNPDFDPNAPSKPRGRMPKNKILLREEGSDSGAVLGGVSGAATKRTFEDITSADFLEGDTSVLSSKLDDGGTSKTAKDIILALLDSNGHVFPGDKGLWFGFMSMWAQKFPDNKYPVQDICNGALTLLIDSGLAQKIQFSFRDTQGHMKIGTLITRKDIDPRSLEVMGTKEKIKAAFPAPYVPPELLPSDIVGKALFDKEVRQHHQIISNPLNALVTSQALSSHEDNTEVLDAEFYSTMSGRITRRIQKNLPYVQISDSDSEFEARHKGSRPAYKDDVFIGDSIMKSRKSRRKRGTSSRRGFSMRRLGAAGNKERNFNFSLYQQTLESRLDQDTDSELLDIMSQEFAESQVAQWPITWAPATTYLQEPISTSWSISLNQQITTKTHRRHQLPEPITLLQTLSNPAWNFRPSGHGRRPIFTRPSRKATGNHLREIYWEKTKYGFRPALMQNMRNRMEGLALSPKFLLPQLSSQRREEIPRTASTKRARRASKLARNPSGTSPMDMLHSRGRPRASVSSLRRDWGASISPLAKNPGLDSLFMPEKQTSIASPKQLGNSFLRFLDPNTCLEDSAITGPVSCADSLEAPGWDALKQEQIFYFKYVNGGKPFTISWVEPMILKAQGRTWVKMIDFEFEEGSFTMQGWFPSVTDTLKQLFPRNLEDFLAVRQGRRTTAVGDYASRQWTTFVEGVESVTQWEQGKGKDLMAMGTIAPEYRFINHSIGAMRRPVGEEPVKYYWLSENQFNLESLPYYELCSDEDEIISSNNDVNPRNRRKKPQESASKPVNQQKVIQNMFTTRRLVALPSDVEGILDVMRKRPEFAVEVAFDHPQDQPRKRTRDGKMSERVENRLIVTVIVIRTLTGGLNKVIDWVLVSRLFPGFTLHFVRKRWLSLLEKHKDPIERMGADFQRSFLEAYENGEVPPIDYDHLLNYDWDRVIDWAIERVGKNAMAENVPELPGSRFDLERIFDVKESYIKKAWRDDYFSPLAPVYRRMDNAASEPYTLPATTIPKAARSVDTLTIAKSWVRASVLTPEEDYDAKFTAQKISILGNDVIRTAIDALMESKVICRRNRGRPTPGRGFDVTDAVNISLRKHLGEKQFSSAIKYKTILDEKFCAGETVMLDWAADDGEMLAITNLQAHGRIRTVGRDIPSNKFGLNDGNYQTKQMDKHRLLFDIEIVPTPSYVYGRDLGILEILSAAENAPPKSEALPIWYGISGKLIPIYWRKVVIGVLGTMSLRPAIRISELGRIFTPALVEWEIRMLVDWLVRIGALELLMEGQEGWNVREWWWMIAGMV